MNGTFNYNGSNIHYQIQGSGPSVVLLHGFGEAGFIWKEMADELADQYSVLIPDLPGSGDSESISDMSMEGMASALLALTQSLAWKEYVLIGHSMGGYITLAWAELFPETLKGLGLFHSTAFADTDEKKETREKGIRFIQDHGASSFLASTSPNLFAPASRDKKPKLIDNFIRQSDNFLATALVSYYRAMMARPDRRELLISSTYPVLIVMGEHDQAIPLSDGLKLCSLPKKAYIHILSQSGHMGMLEEPAKSLKILQQFLENC